MPTFNFTALLIAALIPLIIGWIYYNPNVLGGILDKEKGISNPDDKKSHHLLVYILTLVLSFLIAMLIAAIFSGHPEEEKTIMHGAFHGSMAAVFMGIPTFAIIALFESKSAKYILIHAIYWYVSMGLMGAVIGYFG